MFDAKAFDAAELLPRRQPRIGIRHAVTLQVGGELLEVVFDLGRETFIA
jgi:hypothetical protein